MPRLSICIPTYNRSHMLAQTLETIRSQTYGDFELIIVDNDSTDDTEQVVRGFSDSRLRYVRNPSNVGLIRNQNRCIEEARGEFIAVYHDHDFYEPDLVRRSLEIFDKYPSVGVVCSAVYMVDPEDPGKVFSKEICPWSEMTPGRVVRNELLHRWDSRITAPTAMVRRVCYEQAGVFRPEMGGGADRELWLRILRRWDLGYIREPLARLRDRPRQMPSPEKAAAHAVEHWEQLIGQVRIQSVHLEEEFHSRWRRAWERARLKVTALREFWRWALLMLAKGYTEACRQGPDAFRAAGLNVSAGLFAFLQRSLFARESLAKALRTYRNIHWRHSQG